MRRSRRVLSGTRPRRAVPVECRTRAATSRPERDRTMDAITQPAEGTSPGDAHTYRMPLPRPRRTPDVSHGPPDGAWWPRRDTLELELPGLVSSLDCGTVGRRELLVIPPDEPAGAATRLLTAAAAPDNPLPARRMPRRSPRTAWTEKPEKPLGSRKEGTDSGEGPMPVGPR
ncbi:DUF5994 family protein [Streptomyces luteogriseus]|uniref:DUF5994 family protein n=1 Tax=Streptomyces luteogriseus TaxID=68233 RepID=UPI00381D4AE5